MGFPTNKQIHSLNQNALVSLSNDEITEEKVKTNILPNPHLPGANKLDCTHD